MLFFDTYKFFGAMLIVVKIMMKESLIFFALLFFVMVGFFQGFVPTTARQAANSAVRFSSYTTLRQLAQSYVAPGEKLGAISTFGIGGLAGVITVYVSSIWLFSIRGHLIFIPFFCFAPDT